MALTPGTRLGAYEVVALIGAGGMGEVYRARDTKLDRDVAIKVLPDAFAADAERVARFQREAHLLASLNHPNIAHIHGLEEAGASKALVLELIEGFTLADRIAQGPIPLDEALAIAKQVAAALDAAHEHGVIHRDLKPANIKMTEDGLVKVLDFGLAKAAEGVRPGAEMSASPTITSPLATVQGVLLGTAAYMSPEQARGKPADKRADIWAFGCVLFEMLTGRRAFEGDEVSDILAAILRGEPQWTLLPAATPPAVGHVLHRCLEKDRKKRAADIADVLFELNENLVIAPPPVPPAKTARWKIAAAALTGTAIGVLATIFIMERWWVDNGTTSVVTRSLLDAAPADQLRADTNDEVVTGGLPTRTTLALSPDGRFVVFSASRGGSQQLFLRSLDQLAAVPIVGTENARSPFFSPDSEWLGFWSGGWLRKIPVRGGAATGICQTAPIMGASWSSDDSIVFGRGATGLFRVSANGGSPEPFTTLDTAKGELSHRLPHALPDNRGVLFTVTRAPFPAWDETTIDLQNLNTRDRKTIIEGGADARYVASGHLVYVRRGTLMAAPFSLEHLTASAGAVTVVSGVMQAANTPNTNTESGAGQFATSLSGTLAYVPGSIYEFPERMLFWIDRDGREEPLKMPPKPYIYPRLSPDGSQIAIATQGDRSIWIHDLSRNTQAKLTSEGRNIAPVWSPDGQSVAFGSATVGTEHLVLQRLESGGAPQRLTSSEDAERPAEWSKSADALVYTGSTNQGYDIRVLEKGKSRTLVSGRFQETYPAVSPDGLWLAYTSNESGRNEVYVVPFGNSGRPVVISTNGGSAPSWHPRGGELFYVEPLAPTVQGSAVGSGANRMMSVTVKTSPGFTAGAPSRLFEARFVLANVVRGYDISPDGRRFLMVRNQDRPLLKPDRIVLVQNWARELTRMLPGR